MKLQYIFLLSACIFHHQASFSQHNETISWWNPAKHEFNVIGGQAWPEDRSSDYSRLPAKAEGKVREAVWSLSKHSAGLVIRFRSNSSEINVRYKVEGRYAMPHMPSTGVSGIDLYAKNSEGEWLWCRGRYQFGDTVKYDFSNINPEDAYHNLGREYQLYLPLYNSVEWLEIGVSENSRFEPLPVRLEKPIVVYGTSIAQGACASRPGMAWTAMLERKLDNPLINLGFSGNGKLENDLLNLIAQIDAKMYVLDCLPNLVPTTELTLDEVRRRIVTSVDILRKHRPTTPILFVAHAGYADGTTNPNRQSYYTVLNKVLQEAFASLKKEGAEHIYLLSKKELNLGLDDFVDGTHPSDLGMLHYAQGYENSIRSILNQPTGKSSTTMPVTQRREPGNYDWEKRHSELLELNKTDPPNICFFGNSITHFGGGIPEGPFAKGEKSWQENFNDLGIRNFGFGWDRIENVLWRVYHGELDGFEAEQVVLLLGTNNLHLNSDEEILEGLELLVGAIKTRQPQAKISLIGILPRRDQEVRIYDLNLKFAILAGKLHIHYADFGHDFLTDEGQLDESFFSDGLHPNAKGYGLLGPALREHLINDTNH